jgi:Transposase IS116/IS110/IS902 family/Rieske [2Fe-2S] domain
MTGSGNQNYVCPCHGSTFDVNGRVVGGPAPAAFHQYPTQFTGWGLDDHLVNRLTQLLTMRAIGPIGASVLATEIFGWRRIRNRRELGALVGLVPAPYQSGETNYDQGITRAGSDHVRRVIVQLAWGWIRHFCGGPARRPRWRCASMRTKNARACEKERT